MKIRIVPALLAGVLLATAPAFSQESASGPLRAGAAKAEITPQPGDLAIATDSIRDPLFVRAIVVDNGHTCAVLVGVDGGARDPVVNDAIPRASASTGCPRENFIVSGTHSHSASTAGIGQDGKPAPKQIADAIVSAADLARSRLAPARVGYGTAKVDLNVNRDLFNSKQEWRQAPNPNGPSDKTLAVVEFVGADDVPIGVYMNYAMHPINFYLSGVISADFPGEASRYVEEMFDNRTVAVFTQGASGDQNPRMAFSPSFFLGERLALTGSHGTFAQTLGPPPPIAPQTGTGFSAQRASTERQAIPAGNLAAYKKAIARTSDYVVMMGTLIGATAIRVMRDDIKPVGSARIWGGQEKFTCPGRDRLDAANPARENVFPGYKEGADVNLKVGLLRIGDINFASVNGEVYSQIAMRLKAEAPANKTIVVTLANGAANSGYIYSDEAYSHLTFQVIGSRLQPGCAESRIVSTAIGLMHRSGE
jgi:neutral ceramidase